MREKEREKETVPTCVTTGPVRERSCNWNTWAHRCWAWPGSSEVCQAGSDAAVSRPRGPSRSPPARRGGTRVNGNPEARRRVASVARASSRSSSSSTGSSGTTSSRRSSAGREKEREIKMQLRIYLARNSAFWKDWKLNRVIRERISKDRGWKIDKLISRIRLSRERDLFFNRRIVFTDEK